VHEPEKAIARSSSRDEHFDKLVVEVDEPEAEIERIRQAAAASVPLGVCQLELGTQLLRAPQPFEDDESE
jgi:hypothetical protein